MHIERCVPLLAALMFAGAAPAADLALDGDIEFHNDVVQIAFSLDAGAADVRLWTDSWQAGLNFDPAIALWRPEGGDYLLLALNDDDPGVGTGQGWYDSGLLLPALPAGDYRVTLVAALNAPLGQWLSEGFVYDGETPIPIDEWDQPTYDPNANDQKGPYWRLHLDGVSAASIVPEPGSWMLMALGVAALALRGRSRRPESARG